MLWVDVHRPKALDKLDYGQDQAECLQRLVRAPPRARALLASRRRRIMRRRFAQAEAGDVPHMLFHGPPGSGKKTRIMAFLRAVYGPGVAKVGASRGAAGLDLSHVALGRRSCALSIAPSRCVLHHRHMRCSRVCADAPWSGADGVEPHG